MSLPKGVILISGNNGHGKSNLLEAIHILAAGKSQRAANDSEIVLRENNIVKDYARIYADVVRKNQDVTKVQMDLIRRDISSLTPKSSDLNKGKPVKFTKVFNLNSSIIKVSNFIGQVNVVIFTAKDLDLVYGSPILRRKYIDLLISQIDKKYIKSLQNFNRVVVQRNHLLKMIRAKKSFKDQLTQWDDIFVDSAQYLIRSRGKIIKYLCEIARPLHHDLSNNDSILDIKYQPSIPIDLDSTIEEGSNFIRNLFESNQDKELNEGVTLFGPHRDDFLMTLDGASISSYYSRGQSRTFLLSVKLAESELYKKMIGQEPIILLDDIMSELDKFRQSYILDRLMNYEQCIITSAEADIFTENIVSAISRFRVENGTIH